jgi:hypothetical protein
VKDADTFVIGGAGVVPSEPFTFQLHEEVTLHVQPTSLAARKLGKGILGLGGAITVVSLIASYALVGSCLVPRDGDACGSASTGRDLLYIDLLGAGLAALGGIIMLANPPTKFSSTGD